MVASTPRRMTSWKARDADSKLANELMSFNNAYAFSPYFRGVISRPNSTSPLMLTVVEGETPLKMDHWCKVEMFAR